jgi:hypothetical protein
MKSDDPFFRISPGTKQATSRRFLAPPEVKERPPSQTTSSRPFQASTYEAQGRVAERGDRGQREPLRRLDPPVEKSIASNKTMPFDELHDRLLNDPDSVRFDRDAMLTFRTSNITFDAEIRAQPQEIAHTLYSMALRGHLACLVGDDGAVPQDESQFVLRGIQSHLNRHPDADPEVHRVANGLKRLVGCGIWYASNENLLSRGRVYVERLLKNPLVPRVLIHGSLADPNAYGPEHAVIVELVKRKGPPDTLDAIVFNTGDGCCEENGHRRVGSAADNKWTTSVTFRNIPEKAMTADLIQKLCTNTFPLEGPQSLYDMLGNLPGAWRDDGAPAVVQARQKREDCSFEAHLALIKYHTSDAVYRAHRAEIYATSLEDVRHEIGDQVADFDRAAAKTAYMQEKALGPLSAAATERHRKGF